ncbi:MAG: hypothetical protein Q7S76_02360, partial [bacterium]|nr:hypothetical protein [bacterium]
MSDIEPGREYRQAISPEIFFKNFLEFLEANPDQAAKLAAILEAAGSPYVPEPVLPQLQRSVATNDGSIKNSNYENPKKTSPDNVKTESGEGQLNRIALSIDTLTYSTFQSKASLNIARSGTSFTAEFGGIHDHSEHADTKFNKAFAPFFAY